MTTENKVAKEKEAQARLKAVALDVKTATDRIERLERLLTSVKSDLDHVGKAFTDHMKIGAYVSSKWEIVSLTEYLKAMVKRIDEVL